MGKNIIESDARKNINIALSLTAIVPFLVFIYIITVRIGSPRAFSMEVGTLILIAFILQAMGLYTGWRLMWSTTHKLLAYNQRIRDLQNKLIQRRRLAAINETVLTLGHEINNPLAIMCGMLELLRADLEKMAVPREILGRLDIVMKNSTRIADITRKLRDIKNPASKTVMGNKKMLDINKSLGRD